MNDGSLGLARELALMVFLSRTPKLLCLVFFGGFEVTNQVFFLGMCPCASGSSLRQGPTFCFLVPPFRFSDLGVGQWLSRLDKVWKLRPRGKTKAFWTAARHLFSRYALWAECEGDRFPQVFCLHDMRCKVSGLKTLSTTIVTMPQKA